VACGTVAISSRKNVPPSASSKRPRRRFSAPVNDPFSCPNSSESSRLSERAPQFTRTKGAILPLRPRVDRARHELFPRAGLAVNHDRRVARGHPPNPLKDTLHRRRLSDHLTLARLAPFAQVRVLHPQNEVLPLQPFSLRSLAYDAVHLHTELLRRKRLRNEIDGPQLHRLDHTLDRPVCRDHHHICRR
jgi:hypothetical protein